ncbi:MAG TPA: DUF3467 domain-containing protein [Armatimonadota bacterium]|nr:DUF3467 domain-containing protein [Armatimonadota bacterium]
MPFDYDAAEDFPVIYANFARLTHGPLEFLVDFKRSSPEHPDPNPAPPLVRIVLHPVVAKSLVRALEENIRNYEKTFGEVPELPHEPSVMH